MEQGHKPSTQLANGWLTRERLSLTDLTQHDDMSFGDLQLQE